MKKYSLLILFVLLPFLLLAQGRPYLKNFTDEEYGAYSRNFDIAVDDNGIVWLANFEGLVYYDNARWRVVHTDGLSRITVVYCDKNNTVWVGGYNFFGRVAFNENGEVYLKKAANEELYAGEVQEIWEKGDSVKFFVSNGNIGNFCRVEQDSVVLSNKLKKEVVTGLSDLIDIQAAENGIIKVLNDTTQYDTIADNYVVNIRKNKGIEFLDYSGNVLSVLNEESGLFSDNVAYTSYNGRGVLWGATDKSVFAVQTPSPYMFFSQKEGLSGIVQTLGEYNGTIYAGTLNGLFVLDKKNNKFKKYKKNVTSCWAFLNFNGSLFCATPEGVLKITEGQPDSFITSTFAMSLAEAPDNKIYCGCIDGLYIIDCQGKGKKINDFQKVVKILKDSERNYWIQNLYGVVLKKPASEEDFYPITDGEMTKDNAVVIADGKAVIVDALSQVPFSYPMTSYNAPSGILYLTDNAGKKLYRWKDGEKMKDDENLFYPLKNIAVRSILEFDGRIWLGTDNGITVVNPRLEDPAFKETPVLKVRSVTLNGDSVIWGGFGEFSGNLGKLKSDERNLKFEYSLDYVPIVGKTLYRYRINGGQWIAWDDDKDAEFFNLHYGSYNLEIQGKAISGEETEIVSVKFEIEFPFYRRWYMNVLYGLALAALIFAIVKYRIKMLEEEKIKLENIVSERTAEVVKQKDEIVKQKDEIVKQKDEIEIKSKSLEKALDDLSNAQNELIRQEKMATVGKLTQGLIDRILNPLNYINNFSKLSESLVKDIEANIEDDKDKMDEDNYEDTLDVLNMLKGNLQKVGEHGQNTTRTLKAMEEMLKDRSGGVVKTNLCRILKKNEEVVSKYHEECIKKYGIKVTFEIQEEGMPFEGNPELLSKTFMSIINNGFYAVIKKADRTPYPAEIYVKATSVADKYVIKFRDNGIGIEQTIIDKVFDPFFTTKPTGEASGVGLYLSREIIQNHHGDIFVESEKDNFTEFTVVFDVITTKN
ncbi:MAG: hypothetical protein II956_03850 [Bacteroidales bacterium]|nr:hypothetical protein [Bacteroidales bacterium]